MTTTRLTAEQRRAAKRDLMATGAALTAVHDGRYPANRAGKRRALRDARRAVTRDAKARPRQ